MRLALAPKAVEVQEEEAVVENEVVDVVIIKHDSDKKRDNARWLIMMIRWYR
jgi:hypothetical protein